MSPPATTKQEKFAINFGVPPVGQQFTPPARFIKARREPGRRFAVT
jgi:hypothetical protein